MGAVLEFAVGMEPLCCSECGITYAIAGNFLRNRKKIWYCPNGHSQLFCKSEAVELREKLAKEEQARKWAEEARDSARRQLDLAERHAKAARTQARKARERCAASLCPVPGCHRSFATARLQRHLKTKHPHWTPETVKEV